jgi:hypothetical protein
VSFSKEWAAHGGVAGLRDGEVAGGVLEGVIGGGRGGGGGGGAGGGGGGFRACEGVVKLVGSLNCSLGA